MFSKKFLRKFIVASVAVGALTCAPESFCLPIGTAVVHAEVNQYVGVGESIVSDREIPELDTDEVVAFTAGVVKVGTVKYEPVPVEQWMKYRATVVVTIDTDDLPNQINAWLKRNARDRSNIVAQNKDLQNLVDRQAKRVEDLERTITATKDTATVQQEITRIETDTQIIQKTADGNRAYFNGDYSTAAKNYSDVLKLKEFEFNGLGISGRRISPGKLEADEQFRYKVNDDGSYNVKMKLRPEDVDKLQTYFER